MTPLKLKHPIERRSTATGEVVDRVTELTFVKPNLGAMMDAFGSATGADGQADVGVLLTVLAANAAGISVSECRSLDLEDGMKVLTAVQGFLPSGLVAGLSGSTSSLGISASPQTGEAGAPPNSGSSAPAPAPGTGG
ncbi:phage tail assembly protein [Pararoseomonas sp. SCSIO 73927]|uniref:phage tail assembly protein n=1 Tax=Pararoseomonas sp. SCSIO 73927 TaxID=3114537 RepID=UPI0030D0918A